MMSSLSQENYTYHPRAISPNLLHLLLLPPICPAAISYLKYYALERETRKRDRDGRSGAIKTGNPTSFPGRRNPLHWKSF